MSNLNSNVSIEKVNKIGSAILQLEPLIFRSNVNKSTYIYTNKKILSSTKPFKSKNLHIIDISKRRKGFTFDRIKKAHQFLDI